MNSAAQIDLPLYEVAPGDRNVKFLVEQLRGNGWRTAADILRECGRQDTEGNRRQIRAIANASDGQIASGQQGYKLVTEMTAEEYNHYRNWMKSQADEMTARILRSDKIFYGRQPVTSGNGIL